MPYEKSLIDAGKSLVFIFISVGPVHFFYGLKRVMENPQWRMGSFTVSIRARPLSHKGFDRFEAFGTPIADHQGKSAGP